MTLRLCTYRAGAEHNRLVHRWRIERRLLRHERIVQEHTRLLEALPEAVREKIGFKAPER